MLFEYSWLFYLLPLFGIDCGCAVYQNPIMSFVMSFPAYILKIKKRILTIFYKLKFIQSMYCWLLSVVKIKYL